MPAATRQLLASYQYATAGVRLAGGTAGIPALQRRLASLAVTLQRDQYRVTHHQIPGLFFPVTRSDVIHNQVQEAIRPEAIALSVFAVVAAAAMLILAGNLLSAAPATIAARTQAALALRAE